MSAAIRLLNPQCYNQSELSAVITPFSCAADCFVVGTWLSLVEHSLGVRGVGSSNLPVPTNLPFRFLRLRYASLRISLWTPARLCLAHAANRLKFKSARLKVRDFGEPPPTPAEFLKRMHSRLCEGPVMSLAGGPSSHSVRVLCNIEQYRKCRGAIVVEQAPGTNRD